MNSRNQHSAESIVGKQFWNWSVLEKTDKKSNCKNPEYLYLIRCKCGKETLKSRGAIINGTSKGCISCHNRQTSQEKFEKNKNKNIGKKFGNWEILDRIKEGDKWIYIGKCACGTIKKSWRFMDFSRFTGCASCCEKNYNHEKSRIYHINKAKERIGKTIGSFLVLDVDCVKNQLVYMKCKCLFCKKKTSIPNGVIPFRESCGCLREKNKARGSRQHFSKLNERDVLAIRDFYKSGLYTKTALAKQFEISVSNCYEIIKKESWKHI